MAFQTADKNSSKLLRLIWEEVTAEAGSARVVRRRERARVLRNRDMARFPFLGAVETGRVGPFRLVSPNRRCAF